MVLDRADISLLACRCTEKLHSRGDNFGTLALAAVVFCFELTRAETPFNVNLPALLQILIACFRQLPERDNLMPLDAFLLLSLLVGEGLICCD